MNSPDIAAKLVEWLKGQASAAGVKGAAVGLSGGVDSAVVAGLCARAFPGNVLGLIMPCHSRPADAEHARLVAEAFGIPAHTVVLDGAFESLIKEYSPWGKDAAHRRLAEANLKPRLRMATLYFHANLYNYLVVGTGNKSELTVGYFTKYGDGGVDLLPLGNLVKKQVWELAAYLGVPQVIIDKPPTAGLWDGQTDEGEMGLTYAELDEYILTGRADPETARKVDEMNRKSEHKKKLPPIAEIF